MTADPAPYETEPATLLSAKDSLGTQLDTLHHEIDAAVADALRDTQAHVASIRELLLEAEQQHQHAASELATGNEGSNHWRAIRQYQTEVTQRIVAQLERDLGSIKPELKIYQTIKSCIDRLTECCNTLPQSIELPDVTSIYQTVSTDGTSDRLRKIFERTTRRLRKLGVYVPRSFRSHAATLPDTRRVDVRGLARYHVQIRIAASVAQLHEAAQQTLSGALSRIEDTLAEWLLEQIAIEHQLDNVTFHRPANAAGDTEDVQNDDPAVVANREAIAQLIQRARASTDRLAIAFDDAVNHVADVKGPAQDTVENWRNAFDTDIQHAGTFLLRPKDRALPKPTRTPVAKLEHTSKRWALWHKRLHGRLMTVRHVVTLRSHLIDIEDSLLARLYESTLAPVFLAFTRIKKGLESAIEETTRACDQHTRDQSHEILARKLHGVQRATLDQLRKVLRDVPGIVGATEVLTDPGRSEWNKMLEMIDQLPERISVHRVRDESPGPFSLPAPNFVINLREIASDAIDPPLPDQLAKTATPLMQRIVQAWEGAAKVEDIVQYNLGATLDELTASQTEQPGSDAEVPVVDRARELAIKALRRSVDTLDDLEQTLAEPWRALEHAAFESYHTDWDDVQRRIRSEGTFEERLVGIRTRATRSAERFWLATKNAVVRLVHRGHLLSTGVVRSVRRLIARGQAAVGAQEVAEDEATRTLDVITDLPAIQSRLPLVYRKLFSFEPLTEPSLLEGRSRDLVRVRQHFARWKTRHDAGVLILSSRLGDGRTTFLNVLQEKVFSSSDVRYASFNRRMRTPNDLATFLANALGVEIPPDAELPALREALATHVSRKPTPLVCMLDNLEHIVFQGTGTNELIEQALMFFSRTDRHVYWIATIGYEAWRFIAKTTGSATGFVTYHALTPMDRGTVEDLIFTRHRRSGIPVSFAMPPAPSPILRQRLRRARTTEKTQAILRREYFDALHANTEQDIRLALFYWITSVDFAIRPDEVVVKPFEPLPFRFLKNLDQIRSFTLKAFVIHNTLSLQEHQSIFRLPEDESVFVLESLLNQRLIERVGAARDTLASETGVLPEHTYRIRRLALNPVIKHLRDKHFIY